MSLFIVGVSADAEVDVEVALFITVCSISSSGPIDFNLTLVLNITSNTGLFSNSPVTSPTAISPRPARLILRKCC